MITLLDPNVHAITLREGYGFMGQRPVSELEVQLAEEVGALHPGDLVMVVAPPAPVRVGSFIAFIDSDVHRGALRGALRLSTLSRAQLLEHVNRANALLMSMSVTVAPSLAWGGFTCRFTLESDGEVVWVDRMGPRIRLLRGITLRGKLVETTEDGWEGWSMGGTMKSLVAQLALWVAAGRKVRSSLLSPELEHVWGKGRADELRQLQALGLKLGILTAAP